ncbi:MAG: ankyrin repeat domain-containing protein [Acidimicrobiales bacterium]
MSPGADAGRGQTAPQPAALLRACSSGEAQAVEGLLDAGLSVDQPLDSIGTTPLMAAASLELVELLLERGAAVEPTRFGLDALAIVVSDEHSALAGPDARLAAARRLVAHGARLERRNEHGWPRLTVAAFSVDAGAVEALLALGADPNDEPPPLGGVCWGTGEDAAATARIVDLLIDAGADVGRRDGAGWTVLHGAAMPYAHGAGYASSDGANPAALAALVRRGVDPDAAGPGGVTALMLAAAGGEIDAAETLLAAGADRARRDDDGRRALDHARRRDHELAAAQLAVGSDASRAVAAARQRLARVVARLR